LQEHIDFSLTELKAVAASLREIETSTGARFGGEIASFLNEVEPKEKSEAVLTMEMFRLEKLNSALHELELRYGISLGQTIYHFMHAFHKR
jgi:hypothetical protein